ncbi:hypothetical protein [Labrenzia sp. PHM005]|uniref:hypothetical protein n=1 Tax=Labrenzia sp. PHM005 TaxID=2590016 RepID=UPI0011401737|nr:hypothetical protein [Labrenzia sp. PHM005]QDG78070.1 hypothetical protein FJ695_20610 [Labrenzia sp. PHM005]
MAVAVWVGSNPERTVALMEPVVEDAVELQDMASAVYRSVESINWRASAEEAKTLYITALRMPSMMLERLEVRLGEVNDRLQAAGAGSTSGPEKKLNGQQVLSILKGLQSPQSIAIH